jgi:hypothetical protein
MKDLLDITHADENAVVWVACLHRILQSMLILLKRFFSSSPRDTGAGRGPRRGATSLPPLPGPLLHPTEERGFLRLEICRAELIVSSLLFGTFE